MAESLRDDGNIHFTLVGDGVLKQDLLERAKELKLTNISFIPSVSKDEIFEYLQSADLLYVGLKNLPLYRFGMSMNKVFDYMSVKKAILFVSNIEDNIIDTTKGGKVIKNDDKITIANSIKEFSQMDKKKLDILGNNNFKYLMQNYAIKVLVDKLEKIV